MPLTLVLIQPLAKNVAELHPEDMKLATTQGRVDDFYNDIGRFFDLGNWSILYSNLVRFLEHNGFHRVFRHNLIFFPFDFWKGDRQAWKEEDYGEQGIEEKLGSHIGLFGVCIK